MSEWRAWGVDSAFIRIKSDYFYAESDSSHAELDYSHTELDYSHTELVEVLICPSTASRSGLSISSAPSTSSGWVSGGNGELTQLSLE